MLAKEMGRLLEWPLRGCVSSAYDALVPWTERSAKEPNYSLKGAGSKI